MACVVFHVCVCVCSGMAGSKLLSCKSTADKAVLQQTETIAGHQKFLDTIDATMSIRRKTWIQTTTVAIAKAARDVEEYTKTGKVEGRPSHLPPPQLHMYANQRLKLPYNLGKAHVSSRKASIRKQRNGAQVRLLSSLLSQQAANSAYEAHLVDITDELRTRSCLEAKVHFKTMVSGTGLHHCTALCSCSIANERNATGVCRTGETPTSSADRDRDRRHLGASCIHHLRDGDAAL